MRDFRAADGQSICWPRPAAPPSDATVLQSVVPENHHAIMAWGAPTKSGTILHTTPTCSVHFPHSQSQRSNLSAGFGALYGKLAVQLPRSLSSLPSSPLGVSS